MSKLGNSFFRVIALFTHTWCEIAHANLFTLLCNVKGSAASLRDSIFHILIWHDGYPFSFSSSFSDLHSIIVDMEALVVLELEKYILEHTPILLDVTNSLAEIDWYSNAPLLYYYYYFMSAIIFFVLKSTTYFLFFSQSYVIRVCCKRA